MNASLALVGLFSVVVLLFASVVGCKSRNEIDTSLVERTFEKAPIEEYNQLRQALAALKVGNNNSALMQIAILTNSPRLTLLQQESLQDLVQRIQERMQARTNLQSTGTLQRQ